MSGLWLASTVNSWQNRLIIRALNIPWPHTRYAHDYDYEPYDYGLVPDQESTSDAHNDNLNYFLESSTPERDL